MGEFIGELEVKKKSVGADEDEDLLSERTFYQVSGALSQLS